MNIKSLLFFFTAIICIQASAQKLTIKVSGIKNTKGKLLVGIFKNQDQFDKETPFKKIKVSKSGIKNGETTITTSLPKGTYAITILDDEDSSESMTYKFRVYPQEGVGFSNYKLKGLSKPKFKDFDFEMPKADKLVKIVIGYF